MKYLRVRLLVLLRRPFSEARRRRRMEWFSHFLAADSNPNPRILDLGGQPQIWQSIKRPLDITVLNLPGGINEPPKDSPHRFTYVEGDACHAPQYRDGEFDIVFSNSVIEHVGDVAKQEAFAGEVQRIGKRYWIQTPSIYFPIEAHCGMPFWWYYPESVRDYFIRRWRAKLPAWTTMIEETRVLTRKRLSQLFPTARIRTERILGVPKSYIVSSPDVR